MKDRYRVAEVGTATQLLIDDHVVDDVWMLRRVPEMPAKHPDNPLPIAPSLYDAEEKLFKAWYPVFEEDPEDDPGNDLLYARAYAVSEDGFEWHKPDLGIVEHDGSKRNNLIDTSAMKGEFGVALKDPHDPDPRKRYKGTIKRWYHHVDPDRRGGGRLFAAYSADGIDWHMYPDERSIIRDSNDGNGCFLYDERIGRYVNFRRPTILAGPRGEVPGDLGFPEVEGDAQGLYRHPEAEDYLHRYLRAQPYVDTRAAIGATDHTHEGMGCNRRIARTESDDFVNWTDPEVIIRPDELDPPRLYGIDVVVCEGVYLGLLQVFNKWGLKGYLGDPSQADTMDVHLTFSRDGFRWERLANRPVFIPRGVIGSWDGGMIAGARMIEYGDEVRFYYSGHSGSHNAAQRTSGTGLGHPSERPVRRTRGLGRAGGADHQAVSPGRRQPADQRGRLARSDQDRGRRPDRDADPRTDRPGLPADRTGRAAPARDLERRQDPARHRRPGGAVAVLPVRVEALLVHRRRKRNDVELGVMAKKTGRAGASSSPATSCARGSSERL